MALLSDAAAFYTWAAATWLFTASVVVAIVRCWTRSRPLRVEHVLTGFRAPLVLVAALLSQVSLRLYTIRVSIPEAQRQRGGQDAVDTDAAVERFLSDGVYVWPVGVCMFSLVALLIFRAYAARRTPPPPPRALAGQRAGGCTTSIAELVIFLFCVWTSVYSFPVVVLGYMAATANDGSGTTAA